MNNARDISIGLLALCLALCLLAPGPALALSSDKDQPIHISADHANINAQQGISVYQGGVHVTRGSMHLSADTVTVYSTRNKIKKIVAIGNPAHFREQPDNDKGVIRAHAQRMEYYAEEGKVILLDRAKVRQNGNTFSSQRIVYDTVHDIVTAGRQGSGAQRVHITIVPARTGSTPVQAPAPAPQPPAPR